jgi:hypothetical protein
MANYYKQYLSECTLGQPIFLPDTDETDIHIPTCTTNEYDEIWLYAANSGTVDAVLTVYFSGLETFMAGIPGQGGLVQVLPGIPTGLGSKVGVGSSISGVMFITGFVNNIDQS